MGVAEIRRLQAGYSVSARRACSVVQLGRSTHYHRSTADPQTAPRVRLPELGGSTSTGGDPSGQLAGVRVDGPGLMGAGERRAAGTHPTCPASGERVHRELQRQPQEGVPGRSQVPDARGSTAESRGADPGVQRGAAAQLVGRPDTHGVCLAVRTRRDPRSGSTSPRRGLGERGDP